MVIEISNLPTGESFHLQINDDQWEIIQWLEEHKAFCPDLVIEETAIKLMY